MMIGEEAFLQFVAVDTNIRRFARFEIGKGGVEGPVRLGEVTVEAINSRSDARPAEGMSTLVDLDQTQLLAQTAPGFRCLATDGGASVLLSLRKIEVSAHEDCVALPMGEALQLCLLLFHCRSRF